MKSLFFLLAFLALFSLAHSSRHVLYNRLYAPPNWELITRAKPTQKHTFYVALPQRNLDLLEKTYWSVSDPNSDDYGNFLTTDQILNIVKPSDQTYQAVSRWLKKNGATQQENFGDAIRVTATISVIEKLLDTKLYNFKHKVTGRVLVRNLGPYSVPADVKRNIYMITAISDFVPERPKLKKTKTQVGDTDGVVIPATLQNLYKIPSTAKITTNSSQAPIEFQGYTAISTDDLNDFWRQTKTPSQPSPTVVGPFNGVGLESTLDYQYITAIGQNAKNWYWTETEWLYEFGSSFFQAKDVPLAISLSWGWSEADQCTIDTDCQQLGVDSSQYVERVNTEFQKIGLRGVTIVASSGDAGANGRTDEECSYPQLRPDFPAASPYLVSVGATELNPVTKTSTTAAPVCGTTPCALDGTEVAVSYARSFFASGGGFSNVATQPYWQKTAVANYLASGVELPPKSYFNASSRGYPDIAALGHNYVIVADGETEEVGGTSASSPVIAGVIALLNDYRIQRGLSPLGAFNPLLYQIAANSPAAFFDTTSGDNKCTEDGCNKNCKGFECAKGWDPVTGWGSPNYPELLKAITSFDDARIAKKKKNLLESQL